MYRSFGRARGRMAPRRHVVFGLSLLCGVLAACFSPAFGQTQQPRPVSSTELGRDNLSRVAASAAEITAVLVRDPGLMLELKKWVAKDATDHGQLVTDADLTDDAIVERLNNDPRFRAVATDLVQSYGYLVPTLNPDSDQAKEHALLVSERARLRAEADQQEEQRMAAQRQRTSQRAASCDPNVDSDCNVSPSAQPGNSPDETAPSGTAPYPPSTPGGQPSRNNGSLQYADLLQGGGPSGTDDLEPVPGMLGSDGGLAPRMRSASSSGSDDEDADSEAGASGGMSQRARLAQSSYGAGTGAGAGPARAPDASGASDDLNPGAAFAAERNDFRPSAPGRAPLVAMRPTSRWPEETKATLEPASIVKGKNPYEGIPSLYDMYFQANPQPGNPRRFGAQFFDPTSKDYQLIPMDVPAGPDYVVGPGDGLSIDLWGSVSSRLYRTVDREGRVSIPEVGPVEVSGQSLEQVQENIEHLLRGQFRNLSADVSLSRLRTIRVYNVGEVKNPGAYDVSSLSTPLNALFAAGGPTQHGSLRTIKHYRGDKLIQVVDGYDLLLRGVKANIEHLQNGDTIQVPPVGPQVTIEGMVRRPAIYELRDETNLSDVLNLAGGLLPSATLQHIEVQRVVSHEKQTMIGLDIPQDADPDQVTKKLQDFKVQDGDRIRIFPIAMYNQDVIYLEGHAIRPGKYSYRDGMRVTDIISSYKDLMPEPATQYAEIIRLNAPDFHPSIESFNLGEALADPPQAPLLKPLDTVRIFGRYDFENPPTVSVLGGVRTPGTYNTSGQIRLSDAVYLAGGLIPQAQVDDAQVFHPLPDGKMRIFSVNLKEALDGNPEANILLGSRDRLLIHANTNSEEPAVVYLEGDVSRPGRYPLTNNMLAGDLIRAGGGIKPSADPISADLTHYVWGEQMQLAAEHQTIEISAALAGDPKANVPLHNGDVLNVRELAHWDDLGASITVKGEVKHPGTYGIRPGEKLSSIIERAGGFEPSAYPYGAVLQRQQVRDLQQKQQQESLLRVKDAQNNLAMLPAADAKQQQAKELAMAQWQTTLEEVTATPPTGRVAIRISSKVDRWQNTGADIEVRAGDVLSIPKRPDYVMVSGQVFNPTAVAYRPGRSAKWYLSQSGGPTQMADKKDIFVIRADGSVVSEGKGLWSGESLSATLEPGDTVVVPERALAGGVPWQNVFLAAQVASSVASAMIVAVHY